MLLKAKRRLMRPARLVLPDEEFEIEDGKEQRELLASGAAVKVEISKEKDDTEAMPLRRHYNRRDLTAQK